MAGCWKSWRPSWIPHPTELHQPRCGRRPGEDYQRLGTRGWVFESWWERPGTCSGWVRGVIGASRATGEGSRHDAELGDGKVTGLMPNFGMSALQTFRLSSSVSTSTRTNSSLVSTCHSYHLRGVWCPDQSSNLSDHYTSHILLIFRYIHILDDMTSLHAISTIKAIYNPISWSAARDKSTVKYPGDKFSCIVL